jgi:hypothetical protein
MASQPATAWQETPKVGQPGLGQIACRAEDQDLLTETIVAIGIDGAAHCSLPLTIPLNASQ